MNPTSQSDLLNTAGTSEAVVTVGAAAPHQIRAAVDFLYIGTAPCGCVAAAVVDDGEFSADTQAALDEFISDGLVISRIRCEDLQMGQCPHKPKWGRA